MSGVKVVSVTPVMAASTTAATATAATVAATAAAVILPIAIIAAVVWVATAPTDQRRLSKKLLQRLDKTLARWEAGTWMTDADTETLAEHTRIRAQREQLSDIFQRNHFHATANSALAALSFLESDLQRRQELAIIRAAEAREHARRAQENAAILRQARQAAEGKTDNLSEAQREIARRLQGDTPPAALEDWLAKHRPPRDPRILRIDRHIAELTLFQNAAGESEEASQTFLDQLAAAEIEPPGDKQNLLLDSLVLDIGQAARDARQRHEQRTQLQILLESLELLDPESEALAPHAELIAQANACCAEPRPDPKRLTALLESLRAAHTQIETAARAQASRRAMLTGLAALGYEVHESMETRWAEEGRVVLKKSATPDYGLELGGKASNGRMQTRVVALSAERDKSRDIGMETLWCSELKHLQSLLKSHGLEATVEQGREPGEDPLKLVESENRAESRHENARMSNT